MDSSSTSCIGSGKLSLGRIDCGVDGRSRLTLQCRVKEEAASSDKSKANECDEEDSVVAMLETVANTSD